MAVCVYTFEGGVDGNAVAAGEGGNGTAFDAVVITAPGTLAYDNDHVAHGALAAKLFSETNRISYAAWVAALGAVTDHYGRVYFYWPTTGVGSFSLVLVEARSGANLAAQLGIGTGRTITLRDAGGAIRATSGAIVPLDAWCRIEWHFVHSATVGQLECKVFVNPEGTVADLTLTTTAAWDTKASADQIRIGITQNTQGKTFWIDQLLAGAAAYPGPALIAGALTAPLGALTATVAAGVRHPAVLTAPLGGLLATAGAVVRHAASLTAPLGGLVATAGATPKHPAALSAPLGALTATAGAEVHHPAVLTAPLGALVATAGAVVAHPAALSAPLGALTATVAAELAHPAVLTAPLGALVATAGAVVAHHAALTAPLGGLTATAGAVVARHAVLSAPLGALTAVAGATVAAVHAGVLTAPLGALTAVIGAVVTAGNVVVAWGPPFRLTRVGPPWRATRVGPPYR